MATASIPKLLDVHEAHEALNRKIPVGRIRRAVSSQELRCVRTTSGCNAKILIADTELARWVNETLSGQDRQRVPSPHEAKEANGAE